MDNTDQNLSIVVSPPAIAAGASRDASEKELTPTVNIKTTKEIDKESSVNVKNTKKMDKELNESCPYMNGVSDESVDSLTDTLTRPMEAEKTTAECNGTGGKTVLKATAETCLLEKQTESKEIIKGKNELPEKMVVKVESAADISDEDIIIANDTEISDEDIIETSLETTNSEIPNNQENKNDLENPVGSNSSSQNIEGEITEQMEEQLLRENSDETDEDIYADCIISYETDQADIHRKDENINTDSIISKVTEKADDLDEDVYADCIISKDTEKIYIDEEDVYADCIISKDSEQTVEPNVDSNSVNQKTNDIADSLEVSSENMEVVSEEDVNASIQSVTSESEGAPLLLELSHDSEAGDSKLNKEKLKHQLCEEQQEIEAEDIIMKSPETDSVAEDLEDAIVNSTESHSELCVDNETDKLSKDGSSAGISDANAIVDESDIKVTSIFTTETEIDKLSNAASVAKSDANNTVSESDTEMLHTNSTETEIKIQEVKGNDDVNSENVSTVDTSDIVKVSHSFDIKSGKSEDCPMEEKCVSEAVSSVKMSQPTEKLDVTVESISSIVDVKVAYQNKTELSIDKVKTDTVSNETVAHHEILPVSNHQSKKPETNNTVTDTTSRKSMKLDQLLSKIATKAESDSAKVTDKPVPKAAKARKSCASITNSVKSSSSSLPLSVSSSSFTSLTFNVKELEKRGVLDMPKAHKRKAFDPVKKKSPEQRDQATNVIDIPPIAKAPKVKSPGQKNDIPFFTKGKVLKGRRKKGKRSGRYKLPGEKTNRKPTNARKKESEERQLGDISMSDKVPTAMSVTDKVRKAQELENRSEKIGAMDLKSEDCSTRHAFNESLGLSRKVQNPITTGPVTTGHVTTGSESAENTYTQNALDIMTKNSKLSFSTTPSSTTKKAKKSVRPGIDSTTHRTLDSFLKGATYSQMNSSLKLNKDQLPVPKKKRSESQNSGSGDARKRKATVSPSNSPFSGASTGSPVISQEEKKRKLEGITSPPPLHTQVITLVPAGSPPIPMHSVMSSSVGGGGHPIILSPGATSGGQTLIQNGTLNGLPMFQIVNTSTLSSSQPHQLLALAPGQMTSPRSTNLLQPKGMPVLLTPVQMTPFITTSDGSKYSKTLTQSSLSNSLIRNQAGSVIPQGSQTLLKKLISPPQLKPYLPNGQLLEVKQISRNGGIPNGLYPVTPPKTPEETLMETNSQEPAEVSPGGVVPPDKDVIPLCTCKLSGASFQRMASAVTYCQSLDSVDGKVMGCCNKVTNLQLVRPAVKIPFLATCEAHRKRLRVHQCCPGCGHYCTQGRFLQCKKEGGNSTHLFHEQCQVTKEGKNYCPHCGETSAQFEVQLTMKEHKPSVIKDNKPARSQNKARIQMHEKKTAGTGDKSGEESSGGEAGKKLPTASEISIGPDGYSLERFLSSLEGERPKKFRHLPKCLYTPAYDNDLERVVYMLEDKHDPNEKYDDLEGQGALHAAAIIGSLPIVHILVQAGANVHLQDRGLKTPLMYAAENNHAAVVSYLIRAGSIVNAKADDGMTALHFSAKMGHTGILQQLLDTEQVNVDITDDGGWTPLIWAVEHKEMQSAKMLLKRNADPNLRDSEENTTLHWAAFAGNVAVAELLLSAGCDLDSLNMHGDRPLHIAARQDHYECVVLFLARGADVEAKNNKGETPLECCLEQSSVVYLALRVNKQLKGFGAKHMGRPEKLLHRDLSKGRENIPIPCVNRVDDDGIPQDYLYVTDNIETTNLKINRVIGSLQSCQCKDECSSIYCACGKNSVRCWYDKFARLIPEFNMLEPPLIFECNRACECWTTCNNRVVQNGVMSRLQVFKTNGRGWGCRTLVDIQRGTFICEYIGEHISDSEADRREDDSYLFDLDNRDGETYCIDARRYGNIARFINHLCEPNLVPVKVFVDSQDLRFPRICLFASRDIAAMEELGFDYGEKFWIIKWKQFTCTCGSLKCRYSTETIQKTIEDYRLRHEEEVELVPE